MTRFATIDSENQTLEQRVAAYDRQLGITPDNFPSHFNEPFDQKFFSKSHRKRLDSMGIKTVGDFRFYTYAQLQTGKKPVNDSKFLNTISRALEAGNGWTFDLYSHERGIEITIDRLEKAGFNTPAALQKNIAQSFTDQAEMLLPVAEKSLYRKPHAKKSYFPEF